MNAYVGPVCDASLKWVATHLRDADRKEMEALGLDPATPLEHIRRGMNDRTRIIFVDDIPAAVFGVGLNDAHPALGHPWLVGTELVRAARKKILRDSPKHLAELSGGLKVLWNRVWAFNHLHIKWIVSAGFAIQEPHPHPVTGQPFIEFIKEIA